MLYLVRISYQNITFGFLHDSNKVIQSAPVGKWSIGKDIAYVLKYWRRRGADIFYYD